MNQIILMNKYDSIVKPNGILEGTVEIWLTFCL